MVEPTAALGLATGAEIFVHQAFTCCPYAALVTARIHDFLEANGYRIGDDPGRAAASLVNTCGFNASRADQALAAIARIRRLAGDRPLLVCGCLTRIERDRLVEALGGPDRAELLAPGEQDRLDLLFAPVATPYARIRTHEYNERYSARDPRLGLFQVLVATGCRNECRYCVIRHAKGALDSRPLDGILEQVRGAIAGGKREVFLVADDLSSWGLERGADVAELLTALVELDVRYSAEAFEPSRLIQQLDRALPAFASGRFDWIVLPIQSGSDDVLAAMGRQYTRADVEALLVALRGVAPEMIVSTDVIYGYPGERDRDFQASLELARRFDFANFNEYEPRPGTPPAALDTATAEARRRSVTEFLRHQGSQQLGLTRNRTSVCATWDGKEPVGGEPEPGRWARMWARRLGERRAGGDASLGAGWTALSVVARRQAVQLHLSRIRDGATMTVALTRRDPTTPCLAMSTEFNLSLLGEAPAAGLSTDRSRALDGLTRLLVEWEAGGSEVRGG
jgi:MiaB/RimO family radical SAM methylthiotransferase